MERSKKRHELDSVLEPPSSINEIYNNKRRRRAATGIGLRKTRQYRPKFVHGKWTEFPILIKFLKKDLPLNYDEWKKAVTNGADLIMKETCKNSFCPNNMSLVATHELLHALGILHEQSRSDARSYTILNAADRQSDIYNDTENFGLPYDFGSVMHYKGLYNNKTNTHGMITLPRFYQQSIGQRNRIAFKDVAIINRIYCQDSCKGHTDKCKMGGYLNPNDCTKCLCPDGYSGQYCESLELNSNCLDLTDTPRELEANWRSREFKPKIKCTNPGSVCRCFWRIKPANGKKARLQLTYLNDRFKCVAPCTEYIEVRNFAVQGQSPNSDLIVSSHIFTTLNTPTNLVKLNYEAGNEELQNSCTCASPETLFIPERNPRSVLKCGNMFGRENVDCGCYGDIKCLSEKTWCDVNWDCPVIVINGGLVRRINPSGEMISLSVLECFRRKGTSNNFWGFREGQTDPIRVDEIQCLGYEAAGVLPPQKSSDVVNQQFVQSPYTFYVTIEE
uniref:Metalloendopeptidase n=1 Tax=Globodera rostochiensis TaxID=31243 RepID=A0A914I4J6_GLORO